MSEMIFKESAKVISNKQLAQNIYQAFLLSPKISQICNPGQFINILPSNDWDNVMRRPMSIASQGDGQISIIYKPIGNGTRIMAKWKTGDIVDIIGPLGNYWTDYNNTIPNYSM